MKNIDLKLVKDNSPYFAAKHIISQTTPLTFVLFLFPYFCKRSAKFKSDWIGIMFFIKSI